MNLLVSIILSGVIGYVPYRYLVYTGFISENNDKNDVFKMMIVSIETLIVIYLILGLYFNTYKLNLIVEKIPSANFIWLISLCFFVILIMTLLLNPIVIWLIQQLINLTRNILKLEKVSFIDRRDQLFNNNKNPVFIVIRNFEDLIISEGALRNYNNQKSDFDLLEIEKVDFNVSDLPHKSKNYDYHILVDLKKQIKIQLFLTYKN